MGSCVMLCVGKPHMYFWAPVLCYVLVGHPYGQKNGKNPIKSWEKTVRRNKCALRSFLLVHLD